MCGIAGWITTQRRPDSPELLRNMATAVAHRGPDDSGFFFDRFNASAGEVALAHRRLSIIDLGGGHQPMLDEASGSAIVFNGEIYNFLELRTELAGRGHPFKSNSDTEVLLRAYLEWGEACITRLRGMFAFALWDKAKQKLVMARDHFGKKPLFLWQTTDAVFFGSEIKALLAHPTVTRQLDTDGLWDYFVYRYVPGPRTLLQGIRKLEPGCYAVWENGLFREERYYSPPDREPLLTSPPPTDPVAEFLNQLDESVRLRMVSDVPFGAFLSGGIDSSAIVAMMSRHSSLPIQTFSVGFADERYSELPFCRVIAKQFNTDHHELVVTETDMMDKLPALIQFRDAPVAEPSDIPIFLLSKESRKSVKMVLTGEGSDEFLGGYPKHVMEHYAHYYHALPSFLRHSIIEPLIDKLPYRFYRVATALHSLALESPAERLPRWFGVLSNRERDQLIATRPSAAIATAAVQFATPAHNSALRKSLYFDQTSWLPDNLLERGDRMTMAASLEARMPFMDKNLAAYVSTLPDHYRVRGRTTKWILREAMRRVLPEAILTRPKIGFRVPVNQWFQGPMREYLYDHLTSADSRTRDYYKRPLLEQYLQEHIRGQRNHEKLLWSLLNLELWHRLYLTKSP